VQHRAKKNAHGRHRRTTALISHRAPAQPIAEKGRYAVAAALVAGVGVAALTTATDGASPSPAGAATRAALVVSPGPAAPSPLASPQGSGSALLPGSPLSSTPSASAAFSSAAAEMGSADVAAAQSASGTSSLQFAAQGRKEADAAPFAVQGRKEKPLPKWINPMPEGSVTSCFGQRWGRLHAGVDLAAPHGTPISAAGAGVIVAAGEEQGYGNAVLIDHGNGYLTHYGHMSAITVTVGQHVAVGDQIGAEGSTGHSTGPHLHFEVHQGTYQNPIEPTAWMHDHGVDIPGCAKG
jgi:murein DD-endopeptidase MepM/ murein hydrolase activator NlpD